MSSVAEAQRDPRLPALQGDRADVGEDEREWQPCAAPGHPAEERGRGATITTSAIPVTAMTLRRHHSTGTVASAKTGTMAHE